MIIKKTIVQIANEVMAAGPKNTDLEKVALAAGVLALHQLIGDDDGQRDAFAACTDFSNVFNG